MRASSASKLIRGVEMTYGSRCMDVVRCGGEAEGDDGQQQLEGVDGERDLGAEREGVEVQGEHVGQPVEMVFAMSMAQVTNAYRETDFEMDAWLCRSGASYQAEAFL